MTIIRIISDGKPGHLNQSLGLAEAISRQHPNTQLEVVPAWSPTQAFFNCFKQQNCRVDLIIGAGHRTHLSVLAHKYVLKAPAIVMMKPSLPQRCFDLSIIPAHDNICAQPSVLISQGALNRMQAADKNLEGMILIGGPSKHCGWDEESLLRQLKILSENGLQTWLLTTSRRTPPSFLQQLKDAKLSNIKIVPFEDTSPDWLSQQLPQAKQCWVTADSVSMVYEALTANCAVGLLEVPQVTDNRVSLGLNSLIEQGIVTTFNLWQPGQALSLPATPFKEAERIATLVIDRFLT